ncbi:hypothetical protein EV401DRAFT_1277586 [Pisolithus croceorrhizus]|nr:hypothetical protein EV401DRAFT_1277586 [Pisolithus croceorrhizus]
MVYAYAFGLPMALWLVLRYLGVGEWGIADALGVWGYDLFVWIPVSILCVIPNWVVRWVLVGIAFGLSGYFLVANVFPILADAKATRLLIVLVAALHAALALTFKIVFLGYYVVAEPVLGRIRPSDCLRCRCQQLCNASMMDAYRVASRRHPTWDVDDPSGSQDLTVLCYSAPPS